jgi:hypothetical protein
MTSVSIHTGFLLAALATIGVAVPDPRPSVDLVRPQGASTAQTRTQSIFCGNTVDPHGEVFLGAGVVTIANIDMFQVGSLLLRPKMDTDAYFDILRLSREEINVRAFVRVQQPGQPPPSDAIFDITAPLELDVLGGSGFRSAGMFGLGDLAFAPYRDRCAQMQLRAWGGKSLQIFFRFNRTEPEPTVS